MDIRPVLSSLISDTSSSLNLPQHFTQKSISNTLLSYTLYAFTRLMYFLAQVHTANGYHSSCEYVIKHSNGHTCMCVYYNILFRVRTRVETAFFALRTRKRIVVRPGSSMQRRRCANNRFLFLLFSLFYLQMCTVAQPVGI